MRLANLFRQGSLTSRDVDGLFESFNIHDHIKTYVLSRVKTFVVLIFDNFKT